MQHPKGKLIPIGGGEDIHNDKAVLDRFLAETGKKDPRIEIITTATRLVREVGDDYKEAFDKLGSRNYDVLHVEKPEEADDSNILERIKKADGVFFTGGDQSRLADTFLKTKFLELLKEKYHNEDFVIGGSSAGAAALSTFMVSGGSIEESLKKGEVGLTSGLGFINDVVFDTHFTERGRFGRLMNIVAMNPGILGLGFAEDTAAIISNGGIEVVGSGLVTIIDGNEIAYTNINQVKKGTPITVERLIVHLLSVGERFMFDTRKLHKAHIIEAILVKGSGEEWLVQNEGDSAVLFRSKDKDAAIQFGQEASEKHNIALRVIGD